MIGSTWKWCLVPDHSEEEIRERVLTDYKDICFCYLCDYSPMSPEFRLELAVLSLGKTGNSNIIPYITKDNYKKMYPIFKETYLWVHGGCKGKATDTVVGCINSVGLVDGFKSGLRNAEKKEKKLSNDLKNLEIDIHKTEEAISKTNPDGVDPEELSLKQRKAYLKNVDKLERLLEQKERTEHDLEATIAKIARLNEEIEAMNIFIYKRTIKSEFLKEDLVEAFMDRLPVEKSGDKNGMV